MKWVAAAGAAVVLVAGGLVAAAAHGLIFHDTSQPASVTAALRIFRAADPHPVAGDGVYLYATTGGESLDVLGGARHRYPATTAVVLTHVSCGVRLRWQPLARRSTTWTLCGRSLRGSDEVHSFFGHTDRTTYACTAGAAFTCRSTENRVVGVAAARDSRLHVTLRVSGAARGTVTLDWLLDRTSSLPLRIALTSRTSRAEPIVGTAHYRENAVLRLRSAKPLR